MLSSMQLSGMSAVWEIALALAMSLGLRMALPETTEPSAVPEAVVQTEAAPPQVAAGMAELLAPSQPTAVLMPEWLAAQITEQTALFYFSPSCSHCQDAMPAVRELVAQGERPWLGMAVNRVTPEEIAQFKTEYEAPFEILQDTPERGVGEPLGVRGWPTVFILSPSTDPAAPVGTVMLDRTISGFSKAKYQMVMNPTDPFAHMDGYVGPNTCGLCHTQETKSWALTEHSLAYYTLYSREKADQPKCVKCHVTGMDEPGGFEMGDHQSELRDVTCEACHGPSGPHGKHSTPVDAKALCINCHDAEHSIAFTVDKGLPHIDHFSAASLSTIEWREKRLSMLEGESPKPLLAFPEGPTAGSKACKSCHSSTHSGWKQSPHGRAIGSLKLLERTDVGCVRCHATPKAYGGPPPTEASAYRLEESVGCESCHGAGTEHILSPSKSNIVGLGDSCPECVIEAVCTSCHTPKWDPEWELESRLEAAKHP
jgi:thiol-disulfide isomerase/thioredoxin